MKLPERLAWPLLAAALAVGGVRCALAAEDVDPRDDEDAQQIGKIMLDATPQAQLARLTGMIQSTTPEVRIAACRQLVFSGITDVDLFDRIEQQVEADYGDTEKRGLLSPEIPPCIRALASSGNPKYRDVVVDSVDRKPRHGPSWRWVRNNLQRTIELYDHFAAWNVAIRVNRPVHPGEPWTLTHARNLLVHADVPVQLAGLEVARELAPAFPELYDVIATRLIADAALPPSHDRQGLDLQFCKTLGLTREPRYLDVVRRVSRDAVDEKLRKYAARLLEKLDA